MEDLKSDEANGSNGFNRLAKKRKIRKAANS